MKSTSLRFLLASLFVLVASSGLFAEEGKVIAVYGDAFSKKAPPSAWLFQWNAKGEIGDSKNYSPLVYDEKNKVYGVFDEAGNLDQRLPRSNWAGKKDKDSTVRFYVATYTLEHEPSGEIWLNNGNIQSRYGANDEGVLLQVYLNDQLKTSVSVKKQRQPQLFQEKLGKLKKGDAISVAVGPNEKSDWALFALQFTIEEFATGAKPPSPVNIISPTIDESAPKLGSDGKISPAYASTQKAHCENVLKNKSELVFIGDSITAGWNAKVLAEKFGKYKPANLGISGDWIQNVRWRVENGVLDQVNPKLIVLMIGTNNLANGFTVEEVASGTETLVKTLKAKSPKSKILLLGIFPRGKSVKEPICESIRQVNAKTATLADNTTVFFMDITDKLVEADGTISKEVMPDGLHPAEPGYLRWADAILPSVEKIINSK